MSIRACACSFVTCLVACSPADNVSNPAGDDAVDADVGYPPTEAQPAPGSLRVEVSTVDGLLAALARATPGTVIYVADEASLDLSGKTGIRVPARVTVASGRGQGGSPGALLYTKQLETIPLFAVAAEGARFTGLRLRGPDPNIGATPYGQPVSRGIAASHADNLQVDHCDIPAGRTRRSCSTTRTARTSTTISFTTTSAPGWATA